MEAEKKRQETEGSEVGEVVELKEKNEGSSRRG